MSALGQGSAKRHVRFCPRKRTDRPLQLKPLVPCIALRFGGLARLRSEPMDCRIDFAASRPGHCNLETWNPYGRRKDLQRVQLRILARDATGYRHHEIGFRD